MTNFNRNRHFGCEERIKQTVQLSNKFNTRCKGYQHSEFLYIIKLGVDWAVYHEPTGKTITHSHDKMFEAVQIADRLVNSGIDLTFVDARNLNNHQQQQLLEITADCPVVVH